MSQTLITKKTMNNMIDRFIDLISMKTTNYCK